MHYKRAKETTIGELYAKWPNIKNGRLHWELENSVRHIRAKNKDLGEQSWTMSAGLFLRGPREASESGTSGK